MRSALGPLLIWLAQGSIGGTLVAALILGIIESLMGTFFGPSWSLAVSFGVLLVALAVRPAGLFGR